MLPYFISLLVLGIPLCWAEWTMGRYGGIHGFNSAPGIYSVVWRHKLARYLGAFALLIPLVIYMYYVVIEAWCLGYAVSYLMGDMQLGSEPDKYTEHYRNFVGATKDGFLTDGGNNQLIVVLAFVILVNFVCIYRGLSAGIEKFCKVAMPIMALCAVCVLIRVLTLDGILSGLAKMWNPNAEELWDPATWLAASGQIFFSLSVGFGVIINYSSYLKKNDDIALSGLTASSVNEFFEVGFGGMITLPAAFIFLGVAATTQGTFGLGFIALPNVFAAMPGGQFFGFLWFFMLFLAAITSSLSMLQPVIAFFEEGLGLKRHASVAFLAFVSVIGTLLVVYFSKDTVALDTMDFWVGTLFIFLLALIQAILYGWALGIDRGDEELHRGAQLRVPRFVQWLLKYVTPLYLLIIFCGFIYSNGRAEISKLAAGGVPLLSVGFILGVFAFLLLLVHIAGKKWDREGRFDKLPK